MTTTQYLDDAIAVAEEMLLEEMHSTPPGPHPRDRSRLAAYVKHVRRPDPADKYQQLRAGQLIHLAKLLSALGMKTLSLSVADMTLRHMETVEADREVYAASVWNELGALLAEHGDLERSRLVLCRALSRAERGSLVPERGRILANLGAVSLRRGDLGDAGFWADKALEELDTRPGDDPDARLTAEWVQLELARGEDDRDLDRIGATLRRFDRSAEHSIALKGGDHPAAIAARRALATAKFEAAAAAHDVELSERQLSELEIVRLNASAFLGATHRETIVAQAALAVAEFEAAGGGSGSLSRRQRAVSLLESAEEMAVEALGREHAQTLAIREALAHLRAATVQADDLPYRIDRTYTPQENDVRNTAKKKAIDAERNVIRLTAHAGASYFLADLDIFYWQIHRALERGTYFHVILSSPWNNLAIFMQHGADSEPVSHQNIVDRVRASTYYQETFLPVIESYKDLRSRFPDHIELKLTPTDISGSTLLTSEAGFFEPYITMNPLQRTRRGLSVFEHQFLKDSKYYEDSLAAFRTQWELTSTWAQFGMHEEKHMERLRALMTTQSDDRWCKSTE
ncbi:MULTISPECIES: hypothetical protein [unclassified Streptomyces]|uniref:hypothetical protein n=1 Tax=unclassified Streptomyces TaxID=2593676 RepID=UPI001EF0F2D3|nr:MULTISPECIES: hypothetical protein [unclassified Streptomyces]